MLRASYARTFETPFNENLLLSSAAGTGGLEENVFGSVSNPIRPGNRNDFDTGFQQGIGKWLIVDADYFWKFTHNAYDFDVLFNTPITFPISWNNSKVDGVSGRVSTINLHGFQAYLTLGHTRARYFPPETGGLIALGGIPERRLQDRPRSGVSAEREPALSASQERGVDRFHLALRQRAGGERRSRRGGRA